MPYNKASPGPEDIWAYAFRSAFSHSKERSSPGYYNVFLEDPSVNVEITATENAGLHRYTWKDPGSQKSILFPVSHSVAILPNGCKGGNVTVDFVKQEVHGYMILSGGLTGRIGGYYSYFVARFNTSFTTGGVWKGGEVYPGNGITKINTTDPGNLMNINGIGAYVAFNTQYAVEVNLGISSISIDQARINIINQIGSRSFTAVLAETESEWDKLLSLVQVTGGTNDNNIKFYSALYRMSTVPSSFSEGNLYKGFDSKTHQLPAGQDRYFSDMSIWDVYRTQFPWLTFFQPHIMKDIVASLLLDFKEGGSLPKWPIANGYSSCMIGEHAITSIVDAYLKGIPMDVQGAYSAMTFAFTHVQGNAGFNEPVWKQYGYLPNSCSESLELSYNAAALAKMSKLLGHTTDYNYFYNQSMFYKNLWNNSSKFFCPRTETGAWDCPLDYTYVFDNRYTEGDAWHYRFYAPYDVPGLIELFGGKDYFQEQLEEFMWRAELDPFTFLPNPYFWVGNEHNLVAPFLFNYIGRADLTSKYVKKVRETRFTPLADGLPGNDDYGATSGWFLWSCIGLYPITASTDFSLVAPCFESISITLPQGKFEVKVNNFSENSFQFSKVVLNGVNVDLSYPIVQWKDISKPGGVLLEFWMM